MLEASGGYERLVVATPGRRLGLPVVRVNPRQTPRLRPRSWSSLGWPRPTAGLASGPGEQLCQSRGCSAPCSALSPAPYVKGPADPEPPAPPTRSADPQRPISSDRSPRAPTRPGPGSSTPVAAARTAALAQVERQLAALVEAEPTLRATRHLAAAHPRHRLPWPLATLQG